jgi:hypothetical protein
MHVTVSHRRKVLHVAAYLHRMFPAYACQDEVQLIAELYYAYITQTREDLWKHMFLLRGQENPRVIMGGCPLSCEYDDDLGTKYVDGEPTIVDPVPNHQFVCHTKYQWPPRELCYMQNHDGFQCDCRTCQPELTIFHTDCTVRSLQFAGWVDRLPGMTNMMWTRGTDNTGLVVGAMTNYYLDALSKILESHVAVMKI